MLLAHTLPSFFLPCPRFSTVEPSGLLLYNGRLNERHDFLAVEIIQGQVQLKYSTGTPCLLWDLCHGSCEKVCPEWEEKNAALDGTCAKGSRVKRCW